MCVCVTKVYANNDQSSILESIVEFNISGDSLSDALVEFAIQSGLTVIVNEDVVAGKTSSPIVGKFEVSSALRVLLGNSQLSFRKNNARSVVIVKHEQSTEPQSNQITQAETNKDYEEVIVKGIRGALLQSLDIKFESDDIVEALVAEDIGKFPDSNLSEALQRLSGVTISYDNNEGNKVSVRGFEPQFNLVLFNGRTMPSADVTLGFGQNTTASSRAFNFADIASENIAAVEVYKSSSAIRSSGGMGSVIDVSTSKPLDIKDTFNVGTKLSADTSNVVGNDITPEFSFLGSKRFADDKFGVLLSASYQARDSRSQSANMEWIPSVVLTEDLNIQSDDYTLLDAYWYPFEQTVLITDHERERINAQIVLQMQLQENTRLSFDYTYSKLDLSNEASGFKYEFTNNISAEHPVYVNEDTIIGATNLGGGTRMLRHHTNENNVNGSFGINLNSKINDSLSFAIDMHHSNSKLVPGERGNDASIEFYLLNMYSMTFDAGYDIPHVSYDLYSDLDDLGNPIGIYSPATVNDFIRNGVGNASRTDLDASIDQLQSSITWERDNSFFSKFTIGIDISNHNSEIISESLLFSDPYSETDSFEGEYDESLFRQVDANSVLSVFDGGLGDDTVFYAFDLHEVQQDMIRRLGPLIGGEILQPRSRISVNWVDFSAPNGYPENNVIVREKNRSVFSQLDMYGHLFSKPTTFIVGFRYEDTSVRAVSRNYEPINLRWLASTYFNYEYSQDPIQRQQSNRQTKLLPSASVSIDFSDEFKTRLHASESMSRPDLALMSPEARLVTSDGTRTIGGRGDFGNRTISLGSAELSPYTSKNLDLSFEWYYSDSSYISLGAFKKWVAGFPTIVSDPDAQINSSLADLRDVFAGPRAEEIRSEYSEMGQTISEEELFNELLLRYPAETGDGILADENDPIIQFWSDVTRPVNRTEDINIDGVEFSLQHLFGNSGWGIFANATLVESDASFERKANEFEVSFPVSTKYMNLVGFFENELFQARLAYHWRDTYPTLTTQRSWVVPIYTQAYGQLDALFAVNLSESLVLSFEGINITNQYQRQYSEQKERLYFAEETGPRYQLGLRWSF